MENANPYRCHLDILLVSLVERDSEFQPIIEAIKRYVNNTFFGKYSVVLTKREFFNDCFYQQRVF